MEPGLVAFYDIQQEMERVFSYNSGARMGPGSGLPPKSNSFFRSLFAALPANFLKIGQVINSRRQRKRNLFGPGN